MYTKDLCISLNSKSEHSIRRIHARAAVSIPAGAGTVIGSREYEKRLAYNQTKSEARNR
jgi:hypothetical protein